MELNNLHTQYSLDDFFIFIPYYFQALVLPGKESLVFLLISYIYFSFYRLSRLFENIEKIKNYQIINLVLAILITVLFVPNCVLLLLILFSFKFIKYASI